MCDRGPMKQYNISRKSHTYIQSLFRLCLCVLITAASCQEEFPPTSFTQDPAAGSPVIEGSAKLLFCIASSKPNSEYRWLKDGQYITNSSTLGYSYRKDNFQRSDAGIYQCEASNILGSILSASVDVQVAYMGQFDGHNQSYQLTTNQSSALLIPLPRIESYPTPTIRWSENQQPMNTEGSRYQITLNRSIVLLDRQLDDNNNYYKVEALNGNTGERALGPVYQVTINSVPGLPSRLPPSLVVGPVDKIVRKDIDVKAEFECIINASPVDDVQIQWFKAENDSTIEILSSDKYILSNLGKRTLTIVTPKPEDSGIYQCKASLDGFDEPVIANAALTVYERPTFANQWLSNVNRDFGQTVTLHCQPKGVPTPTVHWYFNSKELSKDYNSSSHTVHTNGSLTVTHLDLEHAGMYQCFIRNAAGEVSKSTWLKVNSSPPELLTPPTNKTTVEGGDVSFPCETRGAPKPVVSWSRVTTSGVEEEVTTAGRIQILDRGELLIVSAEPTDSGLYTCNASNSKGFVTASASLHVFVKTRIVQPPQNQTMVKGASTEFLCGVSHDQEIVVTWQWTLRSLHTGTVETITADLRREITPEGTLKIANINNMDIGNYTCSVSSAGGNDSRTVSLTVIELPQSPVIVNVTLHPTDVRGVIVMWHPRYDGNTPILKYSIQYMEVNYSPGDSSGSDWVTYDSDIPASQQNASVSNLRPAKHYQFRVFASNVVGEGDPSDEKPVPPLEMPQQPPSSPPRGFFGIPASNTSIRLGWQAPSKDSWNGDLLGYKIQYKLTGYRDVLYVNVTDLSVSPRYELRALAFFQQYDLQIAAFNAKGVGVYSDPISVMTLEGHPIAPPQGLQATAVNSTTVEASWTPPSQQFVNGINLGYKVLGKRLEVTQSEFVVIVSQDPSNPTGKQFTKLHNLLKYTEYSITVLCYTSQGDGPKADPVTIRTEEDVPSEVGSLTFTDVKATSLKVTWTPPTEINGVLIGYTLLYEEKNKTLTRQRIDLSASNLTYIVDNLAPMTKYSIQVFASTGKGAGPSLLAEILSGVPPEYPTAPHSLGVSNILARSVLLQFYPGFDGKTSITLWIVEALEGKDATQYKEIYEVSDPDAQAIKVENLQPYTFYTLRIIAENVKGRSNASEPSRQIQTLQDAPGVPPGSLTVRALNATALRVSWAPLSKNDWNGEPRGYKIYYKMKEALNFTMIDLENGMNMDSAILKGLQEWMEYEVKMIAYNEVGDSDFSPLQTERTRESVPTSGPNDVSAVAISSTSVSVSWGEVPKYSQNGLIQGFKVEYKSTGMSAQFQNVPGINTTSVLIENLRKFVYYDFRVLAYTRMGDGALSSPEVFAQTMEDVPGPPVIIWFPEVSFNLATIEWSAPTEPNGIINGYMVSYRPRGSDDIFQNSSQLSAGTTNYTVGNLQQQAHYEFRVVAKTRNGWGEIASVEVFTMTNRSPPDSPGKPTVMSSQIQARSVTISWTPAAFNGYGPLRNFTVQYKMSNQQWTTVQETVMPSITTYSVQGLLPNTRYVFRVAATNDIGTSPFSVQSLEVKTLEDIPDGAPRFVKVKPLTTTSVQVSWEQPLPTTWNGDLTGYVLMYRQADNNNYMEELIPVETPLKELTNLEKFVNYEFVVKAKNSVGNGPASTPVTVFVGEAAPTAPPLNIRIVATNSTEISISWDQPPLETQNGALSGYKISYWVAGQPESTAKQMIVREQSAVLQDLHIYTDYAVTIQAYNLAGEGPRSDIVSQKTLEGLPGKPAELRFWNITYTSLDVSWLSPLYPNGKIVNYELSYLEESPTGGGTKLVKFNVSGNLSYLNIKDLLEDTTYIFSVSARTSIGQGHKIEERVITGPQPGSPGKPVQLTLISNAELQIVSLQWENGPAGQTPIYGHIIQSKTQDSTTWETILQISGEETEADISMLKLNPDSGYQFRVIALNSVGISPYSDPTVFFRTPAPLVEEPETPFHYQWWFLVIVALTGLIIILIVISLLCLVSRRNKSRRKKTPASISTANLAAPTAESEEGGFGNFEMTRQSTHSRRQKFAGIRNGSTNNIYSRSPPRPSPASVAYSDDDSTSGAKAPLPDDDDDDDSQSSCTQKPSEYGESTEPSDQESDEESIDSPLPPPPPPSSPPPPPFTSAINRNNYHHNALPDPPHSSWQHQNQNQNNNSSFNAYQYTDSEAESSHYGYSLNGGQIMLNNTAGSRAPLPGFSSFV